VTTIPSLGFIFLEFRDQVRNKLSKVTMDGPLWSVDDITIENKGMYKIVGLDEYDGGGMGEGVV